VGAILRSAAAFGVQDVFSPPGARTRGRRRCCAPRWAGTFALRIGASRNPVSDVERFPGTVACAVPHGGVPIASADLKGPVLWIFGSEAQGVRGDLTARADLRVTIPMPGARVAERRRRRGDLLLRGEADGA
jgi:TrmH family RNA methyltransferase